MQKTYKRRSAGKIALGVLVFFQLVWLSDLAANISNSFPSSLTHQGSGLYKWSTWDYLTTPYIYHLEKKNAYSAVITPNYLGGDTYGGAVRYTIPVAGLEKLPWSVAFAIRNNSTRVDFQEEEAEKKGYQEVFDRDIRFMLGTTLSELVGINLGIAFYLREGAFHYDRKDSEDTAESIGRLEGENSLTNSRWRGNIYGVELGQYYALESSKNSWAWSFAAEYADLGPRSEEDTFTSDAPRLRIFNKFSDILKNDYSVVSNGKKREEINAALLGWIPAGYAADLGAEVRVNVPMGDGQDIRGQGEAQVTNNVSIDGFGIEGALFYDNDSFIDQEKDSRSVVRVQPIITYSFVKEDVNYSPSGERFGFEDRNISIGVGLKIVYYMTQKFYLMLGWNPFISLNSFYREEHLPADDGDPSTERLLAFSEIKGEPGKAFLGNYAVAIGSDFTEDLSVYFFFGDPSTSGGVVPASEALSAGGERERDNIRAEWDSNREEAPPDLLSKITIGMDYRF